MTVFCGPSGSGKTSLAMDTIYAEGQRRYVESLSSYARQFVGQMQKPQVDHIDGLSPAIAIEQRNTGHTPRSTVGTVTEIYDYFRILFARLGQPHCPECDIPIGTQTSDQIVDKLLEESSGTKLYIMAPVEVQVGEQYETLWESLRGAGYVRVRIDGETHSLDKTPTIDRRRKHAVEVRRRPDRRAARCPLADRRQHRKRARAGQRRRACRPSGRQRARAALAGARFTASTWPAKSAAAASTRSTRTISRSTARSAGARRAKAWARKSGRTRPRCCAMPNLTLAKGALLVWPDVSLPISQQMLAALSAHTGVPIDVPYNDLSPRQRRTVLFGTGEDWIAVYATNPRQSRGLPSSETRQPPAPPGVRNSTAFPLPIQRPLSRARRSLETLAAAAGAAGTIRRRDRLQRVRRQPACATTRPSVRFRERTLDQIGRTPLGELVDASEEVEARGQREESRRRTDSRDRKSAHVPGRRRARIISRSAGPHRRSPAAKPSASASPARSAAACAACCTCSTNRRSASTRATTRGSWPRSRNFATSATR